MHTSEGLTQEQLDAWPNCATIDCGNKRCLWSGLPFCFPCSLEAMGKEYMISRWLAIPGNSADDAPEALKR